MTQVLTVALVIAAVAASFPAAAGAAPPALPAPWHAAPPRAVPGEVIVTFRGGASPAQARSVLRTGGATDVARVAGRGAASFVAHVGIGRVDAAIRTYLASPSVSTAEPNRIAAPTVVPSDQRFAEQWALDNQGQSHRITDYGLRGRRQSGRIDSDVNAPEAWDVTTGSSDVVIAVIDSGVDIDHADLEESLWVNLMEEGGAPGVDDDGNGYVDDVHGYDIDNDDPNPSPSLKDQHGTHVAGIIGAEHDGTGVVGICPGCRIMALRFDYSLGQELEAIDYAIENGADIINMSFGGATWSPAERNAIETAGDAGILTVAAAGNSSLDNDISALPADSNDAAPLFPASYALPTVLTVAASDDRDRYATISQCGPSNIPRWRCAFTSWGHDSVDVAAPGVDILSTVVSGGVYPGADVWDGTSMAAPLVAGIAGLVRSANPSYGPLDLKNAIMNGVHAAPADLPLWSSWAPLLRLPRKAMDGDFTRTQGRVDALAALTAPTTDATPLTDGNIDGAVPMGVNASGRVTWPHDTNDVFAVALQKGKRYTVTLDGPATHDLDLWVWSSTASEIFQFTAGCFRRRGECPALTARSASPTGEERVTFRARKTATHYIQVNGWYDGGRYDVKVRRP